MTRVLAAILILATIASSLQRPALAQAPEAPPSVKSAVSRKVRGAGHWAYVPPRRPNLPEPRNRVWSRHPIDRFLLAAHERHDFVAMPPADARTLARRLALTLTQLPPAPELVADFADDPAPDAYERLVDRLLASPHYGERMAQPWLDLAHYADTHGYHADTHRDMWRWRDWVVDSFNRGQPYDEFLTDQLAGDLPLAPSPAASPAASRDSAVAPSIDARQLERHIATGLLRNHMIIFENGVIDEEYRVEYVMDRVTTFGTVALGQTLQCARCHDHKHDPFTREDFYRLFAYFNNVPEKGVDGEHGNAVPFLVAPTRLQQAELTQLERRIADARERLERRRSQIDPEQTQWERSARPAGAEPPLDAWLHLTFDEHGDSPVLNVAQPDAPAPPRTSGAPARIASPKGQALLFGGETSVDIAPLIHERSDRGWTCVATLFATLDERLTIASRTQEIPTRRGWWLGLEERRPTLRAIVSSATNSDESTVLGEIITQAAFEIPLRKWHQVAAVVSEADVNPKSESQPPRREFSVAPLHVTWYVDGHPIANTEQTARSPVGRPSPERRESLTNRSPVRVGRAGDQFGFRGAIDELWLFDRKLAPDELQALGGVDPLSGWLAIPNARRTPEQQRAVRERFLREHDRDFQRLSKEVRADEAALAQLRRTLSTTMVMAELPQPRETHVLERGRYDAPGPRVSAGVPRWLTPRQRDPLPTRADLASWLLQPDHPLTSRVAVNRWWQTVFGRGLVATADDFGTHGAPPTHPELLDWLAIEFQGDASDASSRWDVKRFMRSLVTTAAFRQSSAASPELRALDPDNAWLARGPAGRLAAEAIRDQALAASGLLDRRQGGPGVFPFQPAGLWEELAYDAQQFTAQTYRLSQGGDLFRRSIYTFWKRAAPPPSLALFDAPDRETCAARRFASDTPQQALVLMNDPTYHAAARAIADAFADQPRAIERMFERVLTRLPDETERALLEAAYSQELNRKAEQDSSPKSQAGEAAVREAARRRALAYVAHLILSLDETVNSP